MRVKRKDRKVAEAQQQRGRAANTVQPSLLDIGRECEGRTDRPVRRASAGETAGTPSGTGHLVCESERSLK